MKDFAVPLGVVVAGLIAFVAQQRTSTKANTTQVTAIAAQTAIAEKTLTSQRELAQDEWLWQKRAEVYVELITLVTDLALAISETPDFTAEDIARWNKANSDIIGLTPRTSAYGSTDAVGELSKLGFFYEDWLIKARSLAALMIPGNNVLPGSTQPQRQAMRAKLNAELIADRKILQSHINKVVNTCREDLQKP